MKTRVCHVIESGGLSGSGRMVVAICRGLDPTRFDVSVVFAVRPDASREAFEAVFPSTVAKFYVPEMVRPISPMMDMRAFRKLYGILRDVRPVVVHAHSSKAGFLARFAAWAAGVPRIFYSPHGYSFRMTDVSMASRVLYFCAEVLASHIGSIIVNGPSEAVWARRLTNSARVLECFNGIDTEAIKPKYPVPGQHTLTVAACGRITAAKNPEAFLRMCACVADEFPQARLLWIGGGTAAENQTFIEVSQSLNLEGRLHVTGWLSPENALRELSKADVVVHYSRWDVLPTAVLEAMALGKPVVGSTAVDQLIHGETGFIARTEDELVGYVRELLKSWELRASLGNTARKVVEDRYSLHRLIAQLESVYSGT